MSWQVTPDLLAEAGYRYVMDFGPLDDQPVWLSTRSGKKLLAIPYAQDLNDFCAILTRHWTYKQYADAIIDAFDELLHLAKVLIGSHVHLLADSLCNAFKY